METTIVKNKNSNTYRKVKSPAIKLKLVTNTKSNLQISATFEDSNNSKDLLDNLLNLINKEDIIMSLQKSKENLKKQILKINNLDYKTNKYLSKLLVIHKIQNFFKSYLENIDIH